MIEELKSDQIIRQLGGRFILTAVIQKRWMELMQGARPLIEKPQRSPLETAIQEILEGRIDIDYDQSDVAPPED